MRLRTTDCRSDAPRGFWGSTARRSGIGTAHRTIPQDVAWLRTAVHLHKGCYRGQETIARVHNLGRPPRRLVFLHLDGSGHVLPDLGAPVLHDGLGTNVSYTWVLESG